MKITEEIREKYQKDARLGMAEKAREFIERGELSTVDFLTLLDLTELLSKRTPSLSPK